MLITYTQFARTRTHAHCHVGGGRARKTVLPSLKLCRYMCVYVCSSIVEPSGFRDRQASDYFTALGYEPHKEEFCHRRGVYFHQHRCTIGLACAQAVAIRGAPHVARRHAAVPRALQLRVALDDWDRNDVHERVRA